MIKIYPKSFMVFGSIAVFLFGCYQKNLKCRDKKEHDELLIIEKNRSYKDGVQGNINMNLICNQCQSKTPIIRVPLAFPLNLNQLLNDYPNFENISSYFLKYYSYCHTNGIWECLKKSKFLLDYKIKKCIIDDMYKDIKKPIKNKGTQ